MALNKLNLEPVRLSGDRLVQTSCPIAQEPESKWGKAHFMSAEKKIGSIRLHTMPFNVAVMWGQIIVLYAILYFSLFPLIMNVGGIIAKKLKS